MAPLVPNAADQLEFGEATSRALWNWLLRQQGLSEDARLSSVLDITWASLGLHAARLPSPFATVLSRAISPHVAVSLFLPETRVGITTVRCMRKTLHTLPLPLAAAAHGATLHFRERDALRAVTNAGVSPRTISRITDAIIDLLLQTGPLFHRDIENRMISRTTTVSAVRLAVKLAWERGVLSYLNSATSWNRENRTFAVTSSVYRDLDMSMDRRKATGELTREYFDRYGPASVRDVMWWSGLSQSAIVAAMNESGREWVALKTPWCESLLYMYRDRLEEFERLSPAEAGTGLNFLAHEDVALKAYFETRSRYLGLLPPEQAFNQIGEVLPTVVLDGQVIGTWRWDLRKKSVVGVLARGFNSPELRRMVKSHATVVTDGLLLAWAAR